MAQQEPTFAAHLAHAITNTINPRTQQWDSVAADLITAKITIQAHMDGADYADLHTAAQMIGRAIDTLATIQRS